MQLNDENLTQLWTRARANFTRIVEANGAPAAIAALVALARAQRREISAWLTHIESIVRKLLFAEACRLPVEAQQERPHTSKHPTQTCASKPRAFDASRPETWSARFAFAPPRDPRAVREANAPRIRALWDDAPPLWSETPKATEAPAPQRAVGHPENTAKHFAIRFEAIRRVLADPMPYARRLARIFRRLRRRFPEAPRRFAISSPRAYVYDPHDPRLQPSSMTIAIEASYAFDSS